MILSSLTIKLGIAFNSAVRAGNLSEITFQIAAENQLRIVQRGVIDKPVQFGTGVDAHSNLPLDLGTVNRNHTPVRIAQFDIAGVDVILAR